MKKTKGVARKPRGTALVKKETGLPEKAAQGVKAITSVDPQALLAQAIDKNLPIESMERLLAMRKEMKAEFARDQFFVALSGFQSECPIVEKKHQVRDKDKVTKADKGLRYSYAPIEDMVDAVRPLFSKWGLSWTIKTKQTREDVTAICFAHHCDGHEEVTEFTVPIDPDAYMTDPQKAAAALTYATRYAFKGAFGIQTKGEDNDAHRQEEEPRRRAPIQQPRSVQPDTVPVQHEEVKPAVKATDYDQILKLLKSTSTDPKTGLLVALFNDNEQIDYTHEATEARSDPEKLKIILRDVVETGAKRHKAVKGV
jgi:hypothetical protein